MVIAQGEIWWADLPAPAGFGPGFRKPVLVVQGDALNQSRVATVVCVPLTSNLKWAVAPGNVRLHSPDIHDLKSFVPEVADTFGFLLQTMIGPKGLEGEESFDMQVCTPKRLSEHHDCAKVVIGRHYLIVFEYNYERLLKVIPALCAECSGETWQEIAGRLSRLGKWEFEDCRPTLRD